MCVKPRDVASQVTITTAHPLHRVIKALRFSRLFEYLKDELIVPATEEEVYYALFLFTNFNCWLPTISNNMMEILSEESKKIKN